MKSRRNKLADIPAKDRIAARIRMDSNGCWIFTGYLDKHGYGRSSYQNKSILIHRMSYEAHIGPIPKGLTLDHLCRNRACCNPAHLEPVTQAVNVRRGKTGYYKRVLIDRDQCLAGHPYTGHNLILYKGRKICRECNRLAVMRYQARKRAERNHERRDPG